MTTVKEATKALGAVAKSHPHIDIWLDQPGLVVARKKSEKLWESFRVHLY